MNKKGFGKIVILIVILVVVAIPLGWIVYNNFQYQKADGQLIKIISDADAYLDRYYAEKKIYPSRDEFYSYFSSIYASENFRLKKKFRGGPSYWCTEANTSSSKDSLPCLNIVIEYGLHRSRDGAPGFLVGVSSGEGGMYNSYVIKKSCGVSLAFNTATDEWNDNKSCITPGF